MIQVPRASQHGVILSHSLSSPSYLLLRRPRIVRSFASRTSRFLAPKPQRLPTPLPFQLLYALNARYSSFPYLSARQPRLSCLPPSPLLCSSRHTLPHYSLSFSHTHTPAPSSFRCPHLNIAFSRREAPRLGPHLFEFSPSRFPFYPLKSHAAKRPSRSSRVDRPRLSITPSFSQPARCFLLSPKHPPPFVVR